MKKIFIYTSLMCLSLLWIGCQEDPEPGGTATEEVAGEWWVKIYIDDGDGVIQPSEDILGSYVKIMTFNTSANEPDKLWVYDLDNIWEFQVKTDYDKSTKTFSVTEGENVTYESQVTITDGTVLLGKGTSTSGVKTDSIYFAASFSDDSTPYGTQYIIAGHRRTGFLEDEHE